jgi:hypothetical protein
MLFECFGWCLPRKDLSWSGVECVSNSLKVLSGPSRHVSALRKVLAEESIGVLVGASLPRTLRIGEENSNQDFKGTVSSTSSIKRYVVSPTTALIWS